MKTPNNKTVEGKGFVVTVPDIHHVRYCRGPLVAEVEIEGGSDRGQIDWLIYASTLAAKNVTDAQFINEHRREILDCISNAMTLLGMPHKMA